MKNCQDWLEKIVLLKPKYTNLVALENAHFVQDALSKLMGSDSQNFAYLDSAQILFKKVYDDNVDLYIEGTFTYIVPSLNKETFTNAATVNSAFQKAFGQKSIGSTFEKVIRRVNKHLCKDYFIFMPVMAKVRRYIAKMVEKAVKEFKITSVSNEQIEYFMSEEGNNLMAKY